MDIPGRLECSYCIRNYMHGGECGANKNFDGGCLAFKPDPKGCIREDDIRIAIPLYFEFPLLNEWCDYWQMNGIDTEVKVLRIYGFKWNTKSGNLVIHCRCAYYINEFADTYVENTNKPKFKLIKGKG